MKTVRLACLAVIVWALASPADAQRYDAARDGEMVRLSDRATDTVVSIMPSVGNMAFEMRVKGHRGPTASTSRPFTQTANATPST